MKVDHGKMKDLSEKKSEYASTLTMHGLARIFTASTPEATFWLVILLVGVSISSYVIHGLVSNYLSYKIYTELRSTVTTTNTLPGLTVCDYEEMSDNYFSYCGMKANASGQLDSLTMACNHSFVQEQEITNLLHKNNRWSNGYFHVKECRGWSGKDCANDKYIKSLSNYKHRCFTLNYGANLYDAYSHVDVTFELNTTNAVRKNKIVLVIHDPRVKELDITNRVILEAGSTVELKVEKTLIKRLPFPFPSNCTLGKYNDHFPGKYTRRNCLESNVYVNMLKECGAVWDYHRNFLPADILEKYEKPNISINESIECMTNYAKREVRDIHDCPFPCEEIEYITTPTIYYNNINTSTSNRTTYRFEMQYQQVDSYKTIEEKQLYSLDQVAGEVGGFLGLVIGASFISIIEIVFYAILCMIHKIKKACCCTTSNENTETTITIVKKHQEILKNEKTL